MAELPVTSAPSTELVFAVSVVAAVAVKVAVMAVAMAVGAGLAG